MGETLDNTVGEFIFFNSIRLLFRNGQTLSFNWESCYKIAAHLCYVMFLLCLKSFVIRIQVKYSKLISNSLIIVVYYLTLERDFGTVLEYFIQKY